MNNLPKVVTQQCCGRASNPRLLDRKSDALPLSHCATVLCSEKIETRVIQITTYVHYIKLKFGRRHSSVTDGRL